MSENPQNGRDEPATTSAEVSAGNAEKSEAEESRHDHEDRMVDEWEDESFPASDPPGHY